MLARTYITAHRKCVLQHDQVPQGQEWGTNSEDYSLVESKCIVTDLFIVADFHSVALKFGTS